MNRLVFYISFLLALTSLTLLFWRQGNVIDEGLWGAQAEWFANTNAEVFNLRKAYGHPGGPLIEAAVAIHHVSGTEYETALALFEVVIGALLIAGIVTLTWVLRREQLWSVAALGILLFDPLYLESSPPSYLATLLGTFFAFYSLWLYEKSERRTGALVCWSLIAGALAATRADIGGVLVITFALFLLPKWGLRQTLGLLALSFAAFFFLDPFMWYMPIQHLSGIFEKMFVHYTGSLITGHSYIVAILSYGIRAIAAFSLAFLALVVSRNTLYPLPRAFLATLVTVTLVVCGVLFTAGFDATRYFMPLIFIWELLLPLFLIVLLRHVQIAPRMRFILTTGTIALLVCLPASLFLPYVP